MGERVDHTSIHTTPAAARRLRRRYAREARFKAFGITAILIALAALCWLLFTVVGQGFSVFQQHFLTLDVELTEDVIDPEGTRNTAEMRGRDYQPLLFEAIVRRLPETRELYGRIDRLYRANEGSVEELAVIVREKAAERAELTDELLRLVDREAALGILRDMVLDDTFLIGSLETVSLPASPRLARFARSGGEDTAGMTAAQRKVAQGLLRRDRFDVRDDGTVTVRIDVDFVGAIIDPRGREEEDVIERADFARVLARSLAPYHIEVSTAFFELEDAALRAEEDRRSAQSAMSRLRAERTDVYGRIISMVSESGAGNQLRELVLENPERIGETVSVTVPVSDDIDQYLKGYGENSISAEQVDWVRRLEASGDLQARFNNIFFTYTDSRDPELAGIAAALAGSLMALAVCFVLAFPIGVAAAIYLEEFAPRNRWTDLIEVNINNLAAVPSIIFGLLGLAVFLNLFGLPRSAPLAGGFVLALMTLPTIIIAARASLKAVPPSIREGALGMGASKQQAVFHHVLPLAMPGILTGSIIGMAQALGETAPLLMIGMVAFVTEVPSSLTEPATALPVQIYMWTVAPQGAFQERAAGAIIVLLTVLFIVNILAILARRRFERRW